MRILVVLLMVGWLSACASNSSHSGSQKEQAVNLYVQLGLGYTRQGQYDIAISKFERALKLNPKSVVALTAIGTAYTHKRRYKKAEEYFQKALRYGPSSYAAHYNYGVFLCSRDRLKEGEKHFRLALEDTHYEAPENAYLEMGRCALRGKNRTKAEHHFLRALERNSRLAPALYEMSKLYYEEGNAIQARRYFSLLYDTGKLSPDSLLLGIYIEKKLADRQRARHFINVLVKRYPDSRQAALFADKKQSPVEQAVTSGAGVTEKEQQMQQRMKKIGQMIEKQNNRMHAPQSVTDEPTSTPLEGGRSKPTPLSSSNTADDHTAKAPESVTEAQKLDFLIEQREKAERRLRTESQPQSPPEKSQNSTDAGGDFMDVMK